VSDRRTIWRIRGLGSWPGSLDCKLSLDTTARIVVEALEKACRDSGVVLERVNGNAGRTADGPLVPPASDPPAEDTP
jgi:hypothetical protein